MSDLDVTPSTFTPTSEGTDLPDGYAHIFRTAEIKTYAGTGTVIEALCGHRQAVEGSMPTAQPCVRCKDILNQRNAGRPSGN